MTLFILVQFEGCGREGPIRGIFLAEFHPTVGPRIRLQTDSELLSSEVFNDFSDYVIPKQRLSHRHVTANALGYKVVGYPIVLEDESYPRNQFIFNVCFVCYPWSRTVSGLLTSKNNICCQRDLLISASHSQVQYERAVEKFSRYLVFLEQEKKYLSSDKEENNSEVLQAMYQAVEQLNGEGRSATIKLSAYQPRLVVVSPETDPPSSLHNCDVPVVIKTISTDSSDLTTKQVGATGQKLFSGGKKSCSFFYQFPFLACPTHGWEEPREEDLTPLWGARRPGEDFHP